MREIPLTQFERDLYGIEHLWVEDELRHHTTPGKDGCEQMTDHISTEEAERVAGEVKETARRLWKWDQWLDDAAAADRAAAALRSLAAENERLTNENTMLRNEVADLKSEVDQARESCWAENEKLRGRGLGKIADDAYCSGYARGYADGFTAALGENQP